MYVALAFLVVVVGSVVFHLVSPWWWTPIASNWSYIDHTITITFWITGVVFLAIGAFIAYCIFRFRHQEKRDVLYEPENRRLEVWLTVLTAIGVAAMLAPGLYVWNQFITVPEEATEVEIVGQQWQWSFRLPGADGQLGTSAIRHVTAENPLGLNPADSRGRDDIVIQSGELRLPANKPVKILLRSMDVLHNFYVPEFRGKMDMIPGMISYFWLTPIRTGTFEILCAEMCGLGHAFMRGSVVVEEQSAYDEWLKQQAPVSAQLAPKEKRTASAAPMQ